MPETKKVHIVGAGLSGMVAAINLAREGYEVTVIDAAKGIGGIHPHHPSNHSTPINIELIKNYVGIDVSPCLIPYKEMLVYLNNKKFLVPSDNMFTVERGPRETSIDQLLYGIAKESGVNFEFNQRGSFTGE